MRVSKIDANGDWTFGKGRANYISNSDAIAQNVVTNLRCFTNDWFLDTDYGQDWFFIFGNINTRKQFLRSVESAVLQTDGVASFDKLEILEEKNREIRIEILYTDVYGNQLTDQLGLTA